MTNTTRKLGTMTMLVILSLMAVKPALAEQRRDANNNRHRGSVQPFSQTYYNHKYQKYRENRTGGRHNKSNDRGYVRHQSYGHQRNRRYSNGHNNGHNSYVRYYSGYRGDNHHHRRGIVVLREPAYGFSHCESHGGYYRSGDIYY